MEQERAPYSGTLRLRHRYSHFTQEAAVNTSKEGAQGPSHRSEPTSQGIVRDERGQDQPVDKKTAQNAGQRAQEDAAKEKPISPGQPSHGE